VSVDRFKHGRAGLAVVVPTTSRARGIPLHVEITPPEGGLTVTSYAKTEDVRSLTQERFIRRLGSISSVTLAEIEDRLRLLLGL